MMAALGRLRARLAAFALAIAGPVTEEEWDAACRDRHGWRPASEEEQVRT